MCLIGLHSRLIEGVDAEEVCEEDDRLHTDGHVFTEHLFVYLSHIDMTVMNTRFLIRRFETTHDDVAEFGDCLSTINRRSTNALTRDCVEDDICITRTVDDVLLERMKVCRPYCNMRKDTKALPRLRLSRRLGHELTMPLT